MKITSGKKMLLAVAMAIGQLCRSQGFVNLDFEDATVILDGGPNSIVASSAFPGWTISGVVGYNTVSLGGAAVILEDANAPVTNPLDISLLLPLQGNYSVLVDYLSASIGQTATIPNTAQSLTFFSIQSGLQVTFNGQNIPFSAIGNGVNVDNGANYTIYGANIASYAGQTGQLLFTTPGYGVALLDNIQISSTSVPEPSEFALGALGTLLLGFRRWRNSFNRR